MRTAVKLFAGFCLTIFINFAAAPSFTRAQELPKDSTEKKQSKDENETKPAAPTSAAAAMIAEQRAAQMEERYRIGYQDTLEVTVSRHPELSLTVNVAPDGSIRLPRVDDPVVAVCKTERELADEITRRYKENLLRNPFVNVRATEQRSQSVAVIGAVEKPGNFFINRRVRLLELLSYAGGPDSERAGTKLIVARTGSNSVCRDNNENTATASAAANGTDNAELVLYQYKIKDVLEAKENLWMQPGDIVSVLDFDVVYVYGNVNEQGSVKLTRPLTLRQAIVEAKGFKPASKKDKIRILRQKDGSVEWEEFAFDLKEIDAGKVQDPILLPNDIVAVSEDKVKNILNSLRDTIKGGAGTLFYRIP